MRLTALTALVAVSIAASAAVAQPAPAPAAAPAAAPAPPPSPPYGADISQAAAHRAIEAALAEAKKNGWAVAVAVVDNHGELVAFERMDGIQFGSVDISRQKAWTSARFRRDSKAFADALAAGRLGGLTFEGIIAAEGGVLIVENGKIIGAIGVSGAAGSEDAQCARAGAAAAIAHR